MLNICARVGLALDKHSLPGGRHPGSFVLRPGKQRLQGQKVTEGPSSPDVGTMVPTGMGPDQEADRLEGT